MNKEQFRKEYVEKRKKLPDSIFHQLNIQLYNQFFAQLDLSFIQCIHIFLPIEKNKEPDTWPIIERIRREFPYVRISIPKVNGNQLENIYFEGGHQLKKNKWEILEPQRGVPTPTEKIDWVIVPLVAIDIQGNRIGYGKGFYDRFLINCRADCWFIGLSFFDLVSKIETQKNDVKMTHCLLPNGLITFPSAHDEEE